MCKYYKFEQSRKNTTKNMGPEKMHKGVTEKDYWMFTDNR